MNKQGKRNDPGGGIEWTHVFGPGTGYTWNPTGGCLHGCTWKMPDGAVTQCYAKTVAERLAQTAYPQGFEHHYWRGESTLREPLDLKSSAGIFVGSMADLFGHWVPDTQIGQVVDVMREGDWHIYMTLSKYAVRIPSFNPFPPHVWVGVSLPAGHQMSEEGAKRALLAYLRHMKRIEARIRFMSIEPLWFDVMPVFVQFLKTNSRLPFEWAIIGAASNGATIYQPEPEWVRELTWMLDAQKIPVFFKGNVRTNSARQDVGIRTEFPAVELVP